MSHKSASFQQILAPLELEPRLRRGKHACHTDTGVHARKEGRVMVGGRRRVSVLTSRRGAAGAGGAGLFGGAAVAADMKLLSKAPLPSQTFKLHPQTFKLHLFRVGASFGL